MNRFSEFVTRCERKLKFEIESANDPWKIATHKATAAKNLDPKVRSKQIFIMSFMLHILRIAEIHTLWIYGNYWTQENSYNSTSLHILFVYNLIKVYKESLLLLMKQAQRKKTILSTINIIYEVNKFSFLRCARQAEENL